jgi:hypothetical protein
MAEQPEEVRAENHPEVWGQLGTRGVTEHRKDELRKRGQRGDRVLLFLLVPCGLLLILAGAAWMWFGEYISLLAIGTIGLGFTALGSAARMLNGQR